MRFLTFFCLLGLMGCSSIQKNERGLAGVQNVQRITEDQYNLIKDELILESFPEIEVPQKPWTVIRVIG